MLPISSWAAPSTREASMFRPISGHYTERHVGESGVAVTLHMRAHHGERELEDITYDSLDDEIRDMEFRAARLLADAEQAKAQARKDIADARDHQDDPRFARLCLLDAAVERVRALRLGEHAAAVKRGIATLRSRAAAPALPIAAE
ncbi:MAG: hypothetical protein DI607_10320 [Sphingomonas hengshuiensis]|nr:MAG: hypothetical protein DI607_10320 [Sphingomonas hengshuiensis]